MIEIEHGTMDEAVNLKAEETLCRSQVRINESKVFLTAQWKHLAILNYEIEPSALAPFVPAGTELDSWDGKIFVSVVGFLFLRTRLFGIPIPFHRNFEEVNLRFYVRRKSEDGWRRGVVFIKEIVPRATVALVARKLYNEPYVAMPMGHRLEVQSGMLKSVEYTWGSAKGQNKLKLTVHGRAHPKSEGSEADFITEHHWGYNAQRDGSTLEYRVEHPRWLVYDASEATLNCDVAELYGVRFCDSLNGKPSSAFLAAGSAVTVCRGARVSR
jgi:uncharacterized protein YqjF (DUF2071 family)